MVKTMDENKSFDSWAVVELFGHATFAGHVTEQTIGGASFLRLDVPEQKYTERRYSNDYCAVDVEVTVPAFTKFLTQGAIYSMTPCSEDVARKVMNSKRTQPIQHVELATVKALPAPVMAPQDVVERDTMNDLEMSDDDGDTQQFKF